MIGHEGNEHLLVVPGGAGASIDGGPVVGTRFGDIYGWVRVDGVLTHMGVPGVHPLPIPDTPYEAYLADDQWARSIFAIRLRREQG